MKLEGRVEYRDLEGGVWVLVGDDGRTWLLAGGDRKIKKSGARVAVDGEVDEQAVSFAMVGPKLTVTSYTFL